VGRVRLPCRTLLVTTAVALAVRVPFAAGVLADPSRAIQGDSDRY
jgi:hypothetical protein